jgi:CRISPR-associated protein Cmr6
VTREPRDPRPGPTPNRPGVPRSGSVAANDAGSGRLPLPPTTVEAVRAGGGVGRCSNLSLALNRLPDAWAPGFTGPDETRRQGFLSACAGIPAQPAARDLLRDLQRRRQALLDAYDRGTWRCLRLRARLRSRLVCGLGIANPLEVNLLVDRIAGFPYLPGSSVKGMTRAAAEAIAEKDPHIVTVAFGPPQGAHEAGQGALVFFDALPLGDFSLEPDVMTPHHGAYYTGQEWPADWQSPNPITFLCVAAGAEFRFAVAANAERGWDVADLLKRAEVWLREALEWGAGAKTSSGYGRFEVAP